MAGEIMTTQHKHFLAADGLKIGIF